MTTLTLALTGDSIVERRLMTRDDPVLRPLFDLIRGADLAFTNLEVLPNDFRGDPALESGGSHFGAPAWVLDELVEAGFDLFAAATNHSLDYGIAGLKAAMQQMDRRRLTYAGVGRNLEDAQRPAYHGHPNGTVALLSCCSTFGKGQEASAQRPDMAGRPGLAPLRFDTMHEVTAEQLTVVQAMADQLGLEERRQYSVQLGFRFPPASPDIVQFGDLNFQAAEKPGLRLIARNADVNAMARWVREARLSSDVVLVSVHSHEQADDIEDPAEFMQPFARRMIDEGADLIVGHGPHLLRGMEVYRGKPIFYSLGNFVGQNELVGRLPSDSYERFRATPDMTPGQIYRLRTDDDRKGFPSDARYWETVMPVCTFAGGRLTGVDIHPVSLGLGEATHLRGRPRLAQGDAAASILARFSSLSAPFATRVSIDGGVGRVLAAAG